jgi:hypothetical protein
VINPLIATSKKDRLRRLKKVMKQEGHQQKKPSYVLGLPSIKCGGEVKDLAALKSPVILNPLKKAGS